jgi:hypothetical protein
MTTITKLNFSEDTSGLPIVVVDDEAPGTTIHTVTDSVGAYEEVWLQANNVGSTVVALTIVLTHDSDAREIRMGIAPGDGLYLVIPGNVYQDGVVISAYVAPDRENDVLISGFVNQVSA